MAKDKTGGGGVRKSRSGGGGSRRREGEYANAMYDDQQQELADADSSGKPDNSSDGGDPLGGDGENGAINQFGDSDPYNIGAKNGEDQPQSEEDGEGEDEEDSGGSNDINQSAGNQQQQMGSRKSAGAIATMGAAAYRLKATREILNDSKKPKSGDKITYYKLIYGGLQSVSQTYVSEKVDNFIQPIILRWGIKGMAFFMKGKPRVLDLLFPWADKSGWIKNLLLLALLSPIVQAAFKEQAKGISLSKVYRGAGRKTKKLINARAMELAATGGKAGKGALNRSAGRTNAMGASGRSSNDINRYNSFAKQNLNKKSRVGAAMSAGAGRRSGGLGGKMPRPTGRLRGRK